MGNFLPPSLSALWGRGRQGARGGEPGLRPMGQDEERISRSDYTLRTAQRRALPARPATDTVVMQLVQIGPGTKKEESKESTWMKQSKNKVE